MRTFAPLLVAAILPLLLFHWFVPSPSGQIDFWILWLLAMVVVGLPVIFAEVGLAYRSHQSPFSGMQKLTREADASPMWRGFSWLSVWLSVLIASLSIVSLSQDLLASTELMGLQINVPAFALAVGLVVIVTLLSLLAEQLLLLGLVCIIAALLWAGISTGTDGLIPPFTMTETNLNEWASAVMMALVSVGAGTGLYWFSKGREQELSVAQDTKNSIQYIASKAVFPIWVTQLIIGIFALIMSNVVLPPIALFIYGIGVVILSGYVIHYASSQLAVKFGRWIGLLISFIITSIMVAVGPQSLLLTLLVISSFIAVLILAIFSGWQMKISHMRKSLNFSSEATYNLWRVAIRLVVPLLVILGFVGWFLR
ncbi:hypothetical protein [Psychrobacter sp. I-STPA6b]|uniref:hypothetical protein n=1 Tax=Psychrobacter sp. I-STPA6b TaxID=2585718 RepID=UPI001D0C79C5|nr:hypothetical protein [Psychrobacter sp. I-STPA6b]